MRISGEEGEYDNPQETTKDQRVRGVKDRDRREKPKEDEKRAPPLLQPPPKTPGESQTKRVKVVFKKKPLQTGEERMRYSERPEIKQERSPKTRTPKETGPLWSKWRQALDSSVRRGLKGKEQQGNKGREVDDEESTREQLSRVREGKEENVERVSKPKYSFWPKKDSGQDTTQDKYNGLREKK